MKLDIKSTLEMNNGKVIPRLGLGTWQVTDDVAEDVVYTAIKFGYRHIDSAGAYENELGVGRGIRKAMKELQLRREELFVTTKIRRLNMNDPKKAFNDSLKKLDIGYIDLYLIHWPDETYRISTWNLFETFLKTGKVKSIGVSNFTIAHLEELKKHSKITPVVNQVEFSPFLYQKELLEYCNRNNIVLEAYSPLTRGKRLNDSILLAVATKYKKTPAQILIRWCLQHDIVVLPKSMNPARMKENCEVFDFEISALDMKKLNALNENYRTCWNPETMKMDFK